MKYVFGDVSKIQREVILKNRLGDEPTVSIHDNCIVPPPSIMSRGPLSFRGGVYDESGRMIPGTGLQRNIGGKATELAIAYDDVSKFPVEHFAEAVYGGCYFEHFGHFMVETTARLWWVVESGYKGPVIFQVMSTGIASFARTFFSMLGIDAVFVPRNTAVRIGRLTIPGASLVVQVWASKAFTRPFREVAKKLPSTGRGERLYVVRGRGVGSAFGEATVQKALEREGFQTLDPTEASLQEQIAAFANARQIVGVIGSAMHSLAYCQRAEQVGYLARSATISTTFPAIDDAIGSYDSHYLVNVLNPLPPHPNLQGPFLIDAEACCDQLAETGYLRRRSQVDLRDVIAERDLYMREWWRIESARRAADGGRA